MSQQKLDFFGFRYSLNNKVVKRGGGHDENNMILKNKVVKRGGQA
jgi:hypothetical protein